jgi:hypothetical protein
MKDNKIMAVFGLFISKLRSNSKSVYFLARLTPNRIIDYHLDTGLLVYSLGPNWLN